MIFDQQCDLLAVIVPEEIRPRERYPIGTRVREGAIGGPRVELHLRSPGLDHDIGVVGRLGRRFAVARRKRFEAFANTARAGIVDIRDPRRGGVRIVEPLQAVHAHRRPVRHSALPQVIRATMTQRARLFNRDRSNLLYSQQTVREIPGREGTHILGLFTDADGVDG